MHRLVLWGGKYAMRISYHSRSGLDSFALRNFTASLMAPVINAAHNARTLFCHVKETNILAGAGLRSSLRRYSFSLASDSRHAPTSTRA